jgi:hypothetical protein
MKAAAVVPASATTATALSQVKKTAVPQMPSGKPSTTARPVTHIPVSPVGLALAYAYRGRGLGKMPGAANNTTGWAWIASSPWPTRSTGAD